VHEVSVPVEDLRAAGFGDEVEKVATAVAAYLDDGVGGNVAVVSDPYAGREALLEYAERLLDDDVVRVDLDASAADGTGPVLPEVVAEPGVTPGATGGDAESAADSRTASDAASDGGADIRAGEGADPGVDGAGAVILSDCQHLFERRIDGFEALDSFLDGIALSDALVVTSWNRYAWSYLDAVRDVSDSFTTRVEIPSLDASEIETVVESHYDDRPEIVDSGSAGRVKTVVFDSQAVPLPGDRSVGIPYPKPNPAWTASWSISDADESVEAVVFEKLRRASNGNPGAALAIWEESIDEDAGEIAPGYIEAFETDVDVDDEAALLLWTVLAKESVPVARVDALFAEGSAEASLQRLVEADLVTVQDGRVSVTPRALHLAAATLQRRGMLW
jgi:hypothetical protein